MKIYKIAKWIHVAKETYKTLITLTFSSVKGTTILVKVEQLVLIQALAFRFRSDTALYVGNISGYGILN